VCVYFCDVWCLCMYLVVSGVCYVGRIVCVVFVSTFVYMFVFVCVGCVVVYICVV